jgi:hypothetical protein
MNINFEKMFKDVEEKINDGINKIKDLNIGTKEYDDLIQSILNSISVLQNQNTVVNGPQAPQQNPMNNNPGPESFIGKKYEAL